MSAADLWTHRDTTGTTTDLTGFSVEAIDESRYRDAQYREEIGGYYGAGGAGDREPL